jgi:competence protein ComEC
VDDIQRKLALLDAQLAGGGELHGQLISTCPLVFVAAGLISGIALQSMLALSVRFWLIILFFCSAAAFFFAVWRSRWVVAYLVLACFLSVGAIRLAGFAQPKSNDIRNLAADEQSLATICGTMLTEPYSRDDRAWQFAKFKYTDPTSSFYLRLDRIKTPGGWAKATGTVRVQVDEPVLDLKAGDYIQAYCWLDRFKKATNPGQFDIKAYMARSNIFIAASVKSRDGIELLKGCAGKTFPKIRRTLRQAATQAMVGNLSPEDENRGLLEALLLGYRGNIDSATYRAFKETGLLHLISLSGMHLGILMGLIWWLCKTAGLMKRWRAIICIITIGIFLLIVPPRAPTIRAAIIGWGFCVSVLFRRHFNSLNALSLAAIILLLIRPTQLFDAGWQLSFAAVLGIILFARRIEDFLYFRITDSFWFEKALKTKMFFRVPPALSSHSLKLFSVGLAAWLGGAGILLYHFHTITPLTSVWTVLVLPFVALILILGYLKIILSLILPTAALGLGVIVTGLAELLIRIVKFIASPNISEMLIGGVPLAVVVFYYCVVLFACFAYFKRPLIKKVLSMTSVLALIVFLGAVKWQRTHRDSLLLTCLDVGHGQAILAQLPKSTNILFDAGSLHKSDIGRAVVVPFLDYIGTNRIDAILISHNDIDHINGIVEIIESCDVGGVYANDAFFGKNTAKYLDKRLGERGIKIQPLDKLNLDSSAKVKIIWPDKQDRQDEQLSDNDKSAVCLLEFAGRKMLLCSDIEKFAQAELFRIYPALKADVVVVPHHGSVRTLEGGFLENLGAEVLIYSCGRKDYERLNRAPLPSDLIGTKSLYTPTDGAIGVRIDKNGTLKAVSLGP